MLLRVLLAAGAVALAAPAFAQTTQQQPMEGQKLMQACGPDIQNFCTGVQPGGGRIISCLRPHMRELSPDCKGQVVATHARRKEQQQQQQPQP